MFSQFFILNNKGDTIIFKDYRFDIPKDSNDTFFKYILSMKSDITPSFNINDINYLYIKKREMYFVFTTRQLVSPSLAFELLNRASKIIQDYTASLTEEAIRLNFILIYELLDELMDYGVPQSTSTETLKAFVFTPPKPIKSKESESIIDNFLSSVKPIHSNSIENNNSNNNNTENEIYIDLCERITILIASNGQVLRNEIIGKIQMKSYLKGNPVLSLGLSPEFLFKTNSNRTASSFENENENETTQPNLDNPNRFVIDDCSFHECAGSGFVDNGGYNNQNNIINFRPPQGDFTLLKYRISHNEYSPFLVKTNLESTQKNKFDLVVNIRSNFSNKVVPNFVSVSIPLPKSTKSCQHSLDYGYQNQTVEFKQTPNSNSIFWSIKKLRGGMETTLRLSIIVDGPTSPTHSNNVNNNNNSNNIENSTIKKEIGPIGLEFSMPQFSCSTLQIKFLRMLGSNVSPTRWIRYITDSKSFVKRVSTNS
ncbi:hypothetical protein DICPUDRAFT_54317 [Dictyostelium purpureum]|uniref:MHD domain-containing protein n=1 Tax=Dictyostelium purpureum TaxID=5786 RepID=F0ZGJ2_DICPU|nr:uncharacterized protein DICPUDRAFT_54317 [Dictyostelium purpureum]EGC36950.1 hypothetical protein DICPUDRAFT_54317 [Dictyostelium purpureum]|eukprot:XP_003286518.1 hypothetical protein DICPUDRAFT_54317 [Dictyostelium purpureum]